MIFVNNNPINLSDPYGLYRLLPRWLEKALQAISDRLFSDKELEQNKAKEIKKLKESAQDLLRLEKIKDQIIDLKIEAIIHPGDEKFKHAAFYYKNKIDVEDICCMYTRAEAVRQGFRTAYKPNEPCEWTCKDKKENYEFLLQMHVHEIDQSIPIPSPDYDEVPNNSILGYVTK